ncbi:ArsR/SmtB family transcription factor [Dermacoccaceae bacterium W4C1]
MSLRDEADQMRRLRAAAHPVRLRILSLLTGAELSASEVARQLGITQANASYHLRLLEQADKIEVTGTEKIRGGVAKKYRYAEGTAGVEALDRPTSGRRQVADGGASDARAMEALLPQVEALSVELARRAAQSGIHDGVTASVLFDLDTWMEPEAWREVLGLLIQAGKIAHTHARPVGAPGAVPVSATALAFTQRYPERGQDVD